MGSLLNYVKNQIDKWFYLFLALIITLLIGFLIGLFFSLPVEINDLFKTLLLDLFNKVLFAQISIFKWLFLRVFYLVLLYFIAFIIGLNKVSFYVIFALVFYRALVLAIMLKICVVSLNFLGIIPFIFTIFLESIIVTFSLIIYAVLTQENLYKKTLCFMEKQIKTTFLALLIGVVGIVVEVLLLACVFRPINFYFWTAYK